jgi:hypothetical protein
MKKLLLAIMLLFISQNCMDAFAKPSKKTHKKNKSKKTPKKNKSKKNTPHKNKKKQSGSSWNKVGSALGTINNAHSKALEAKSMAENVRDGGS